MVQASLQRTAPVLHVSSLTLKRVRDFFVDKLGFAIGTEVGKLFITLDRDGQTVMLSCSSVFGRVRKGWATYFWVDDIAALHSEFISRGTPMKGGVTDKPYGCREIVALAPGGREIVFGEPVNTHS